MPGCFTMALSAQLGNANLTPESLETTAEVKFEKTDEGFYDYGDPPDNAGESAGRQRFKL